MTLTGLIKTHDAMNANKSGFERNHFSYNYQVLVMPDNSCT